MRSQDFISKCLKAIPTQTQTHLCFWHSDFTGCHTFENMPMSRYSAAIQSLKENDSLILCLQLQDCEIDDEKAYGLFLAMQHCDTIASVDLSNNAITNDGFMLLTKLLKEGFMPSLIVLDVRGNPISSDMHNLFEEIQHEREMLKVYYDSNSMEGGQFHQSDEDIHTERAVNLLRSKWSAACTDNGDNWLLSKPRIFDHSVCTLKDKVRSFIKLLKEEEVPDTSKAAILLKEISLMLSQESDLRGSSVIEGTNQSKCSEGVKYLIGNLQLFISLLNIDPTYAVMDKHGAGLHRVAILDILSTIILSYLPSVEESLISSGLLEKLLSLFSDFPHNSLLHCAIFRCLQVILSRPDTHLFSFLVKDSSLLSFIAKEGTKCSIIYPGRRPSYSGQIYALSKILNDMEKSDQNVKELLNENKDWQLYTSSEGPFRKLQAEHMGELCGPKPVLPPSVKHFLQNSARNLIQIYQFTA